MRQMPAMTQVHRQHPVARLQEREIDRHVGAAAGMGLDVGVFGAEDSFRAIDRELLHRVDMFTAAVPAFPRIAFGVFVGQDRALGLHDGVAGEVLAGDQFEVFLLPQTLA